MKNAKARSSSRPFYIGLTVVALLGLGLIGYLAAKGSKPPINVAATNLPPVQDSGYVIGSPSAPVEVIEFADFECPACGSYATLTEPDVRTKLVNTGKVRVRYVDFPLNVHRNTWNASLAASCANDQGKFWEMHDALFQTQDQWNGEATSNPDKPIRALAERLGLNMQTYDQCMDSRKNLAKIQAHLRMAEQMHVEQTPTFLIGGKLIPGALAYDTFKSYVDSAAAKAPAASAAPAKTTAPAPTTTAPSR